MRLLFSSAFSASSLTFFLPVGSWGGFLLVYRGTNGVGASTRDDIGNVNLTWDGVPIVNVDFALLSYLSDMKGGFSTFTSVAGGALNAISYVPCGNYGDTNNSYHVTDKTKVYFKLDFPNLSALTGQVYIYGIPKEGIMNYQYCLTSRNVSAGASGTITDVHRLQNVNAVYLKNHSAVDRIQILRDGKTIIDGLKTDIQSLSDFLNQVEVSNSIIELDLNRSKDIREVLSSEINFQYNFTGASTLQQYFAYQIITPNNARQSLQAFQSEVERKVEKIGTVDGIKPIRTISGLGLKQSSYNVVDVD